MFKNSENAPDTEVSKWATQNWPYLQNNGELEYGAGFARESYDGSFRFVLQLDRLSWANSDSGAWM